MSFLGNPRSNTNPSAHSNSNTNSNSNSRRHPKQYDGPEKTTWFASDLAALVVERVTHSSEERPDLILAAWADMMGARASRIQAERFVKGILYVRVTNSMLFSLLGAREREQFLYELRRRFPKTRIDQIMLRMG